MRTLLLLFLVPHILGDVSDTSEGTRATPRELKIRPRVQWTDLKKVMPRLSDKTLQMFASDVHTKPRMYAHAVNRRIPIIPFEKCPDVSPKQNCPEKTGPSCWSRGFLDVSCPTQDEKKPFGLCCFDGCKNSCFKVKPSKPKTSGFISPNPKVSNLKTVLSSEDDEVVKKIQANLRKRPNLAKVVNAAINRQTPPKECPQVEARSDCPREATKPICWSPGSHDVDCELGSLANSSEPFGLCCFDGCQNSCLAKTCVTIMKSESETKVVTQCNEARRQTCEDVPKTQCRDVCKNVVEMRPVEKPVRKCDNFKVTECRDKTTQKEVCQTWEHIQEFFAGLANATQCPLVKRQARSSDDPEKCKSNCWSPGVADVDCPVTISGPDGTTTTDFGLCCFNGCANKCLDNKPTKIPANCQSETAQQCSTVNDLVCGPNQEQFCEKIVRKNIKVASVKEPQCTFFHNRDFATKHNGQTIFNIDTKATQWQDKCSPYKMKAICKSLKSQLGTTKSCKEECKDVQRVRKVTKNDVVCEPQLAKTDCKMETERVCYPSTAQEPGAVYATNQGHKSKGLWKSKGLKSKGLWKSKGHHHLMKRAAAHEVTKKGDVGDMMNSNSYIMKREKREAHHKGWDKGDKGFFKSKGQKGTYQMLPMVTQNVERCFDRQVEKCRQVAQPELCKTVASSVDEPYTENVCKEICTQLPEADLECEQEEFFCPDNVGPGFELCFTPLDSTENPHAVVDHCFAPQSVFNCRKTPVHRCIDETKVMCKKCKMVPEVTKECRDVPKTKCRMETVVEEKPFDKEVCSPECKQFTEKKCRMTPYQECKPVEMKIEKQVPTKVCHW